MKDHEYHALTDAFFQYVEDVIDEGYPDIDCERAGGVLTLSFENKTTYRIAAKNHFGHLNQQRYCCVLYRKRCAVSDRYFSCDSK